MNDILRDYFPGPEVEKKCKDAQSSIVQASFDRAVQILGRILIDMRSNEKYDLMWKKDKNGICIEIMSRLITRLEEEELYVSGATDKQKEFKESGSSNIVVADYDNRFAKIFYRDGKPPED